MQTYKLLTGEVVSLEGLSRADRKYLERLSFDVERKADYFELLKEVKGPGALPLRGGRLTPDIASSSLYRVAHDMVDRVGIMQGFLLDEEVARASRRDYRPNLLSLTEAADLIGVSRTAVHQALLERRLQGERVGNAWVIRREDAEAFKIDRADRDEEQPAEPAPGWRPASNRRG